MRDYDRETELRVAFIREQISNAGAKGVIFGNSGGKDCALVGILSKKACIKTVGLIMPCASGRNYESDRLDAEMVANMAGIETRVVDLTETRSELLQALSPAASIAGAALTNLAPRLRMTALYAVGASEGLLVAGTGNLSERYMGYFTKWGDGAFDFNPIADLTVSEVYEFLRHLGAPESIIDKAPSAGLYEGQTDEAEMGVSYAAIDRLIRTGEAEPGDRAIIERFHSTSAHKRVLPPLYDKS